MNSRQFYKPVSETTLHGWVLAALALVDKAGEGEAVLNTQKPNPRWLRPRISRFTSMAFWLGLGAVASTAAIDAAAQVRPNVIAPVSRVTAAAGYAQLPFRFEQNQGQSDQSVKFLSRGTGYTLFLTNSEAVLSLSQPGISREGQSVSANTAMSPQSSAEVVRLRFTAGNPEVRVIGENQLPGKTNYFLDSDPRKWHTNIPNYAQVAYQDLYPGVDAVFHGNPQHLEFDFEVAPGTNPSSIAFDVSGGSLRIDQHGNAIVKLSPDGSGEVVLQSPSVFQERRGQRREISGKFVQRGPHRLGFEIGDYDRTRTLIIDPAISYSTYLSGSIGSYPTGVAVDSSGSAYLVGLAGDGSFPTPSGPVNPPAAVFVAKLNPAGSSLLYTAFVPLYENPSGIAVDSNGSAYLVGGVAGSYIVGGGYQNPNFSSADSSALLTVIKLSADGSQVVYAAQIGPQGTVANLGSIAVDGQGSAYVASATNDPTFPTTPGAFQTTLFECPTGVCDTAPTISKLSSDGSTLVYSTFLGGYNAYTPPDQALAIAVDGQGDAYVTGVTDSTAFPTTPGAPQPSCLSAFTPTPPVCDDANVFVTKINPTGSTLLFSTFLGDGAISDGLIGHEAGIALDSAGNAYVTGTTNSNIFASAVSPVVAGPTVNCGQAYNLPTICAPVDINGAGGSIAFLGKISADGTQLMYLGLLGGPFTSPLPGTTENGATVGTSVAVDALGRAYVTGYTTSSFFPVTPDALQNSQLTLCDPQTGCGDEAFLSIVNPGLAGNASLLYSTYLSNASVGSVTESNTEGFAIATDASGNAYLIGDIRGGSDTFPTTPGAFQTAMPSGCFSVGCTDVGFVTKFGAPATPHLTFTPTTASFGNVPAGQNGTITLTVSNTGTSPLQIQNWTLASSNSPNPFAATLDACPNALSSIPPSSSCSFTLSFSPSAVGSYNATITFVDNAAQGVPDPNTAGEYDQTFMLTGTSTGLSATTTTLTAAPNPATQGQSVTLTATVSSGGAPVTSGNVTLSYGGSPLGSPVSLNASGQAVLSTSSLPPGNDTISASYGATGTFAASNATATVTIVSAVTLQSITVTPANAAIPAGATQTFAATGRFSDGSTQNLTSSVTWTSSNPGVTMSGATATGVTPGTSTITATLGSVAGSTTLTVQASQIAIVPKLVSIAVQPNGDYAVTISVHNTGNIAAAQVNVLFSALVGTQAPWVTYMSGTTPASNLAPGATQTVVVVFPAAAGKPGAQKSLLVIGEATGTNPNGTAAYPAVWRVRKYGLTLP